MWFFIGDISIVSGRNYLPTEDYYYTLLHYFCYCALVGVITHDHDYVQLVVLGRAMRLVLTVGSPHPWPESPAGMRRRDMVGSLT